LFIREPNRVRVPARRRFPLRSGAFSRPDFRHAAHIVSACLRRFRIESTSIDHAHSRAEPPKYDVSSIVLFVCDRVQIAAVVRDEEWISKITLLATRVVHPPLALAQLGFSDLETPTNSIFSTHIDFSVEY
jgi:hypothetical protein